MTVARFGDAGAFLRHAGPHLRADAIANNLILGIAARLVDHPRSDAMMLTVDDGAGAPRVAALMTPPWRLIVSAGPRDALGILAADLADRRPAPPGVVGPAEAAERFADVWREVTGAAVTPAVDMTLLAARHAVAPVAAPGRLRAAGDADAAWVGDAFVDFAVAIRASRAERDDGRETAAAYMRRGQVFLWEVGGAPMSMACANPMPPDGARVGPVYTPPNARGKGYASACVAALTLRLLGGGGRWCAIFADAVNPSTNAIYMRLGYKVYGTYREYDFAAAGDSNGGAP